MDEALRQYQLDIKRANLSRRRFLTLSAMGAASAALAACSSTPGPSASAAASSTPAPSTAPSEAASVEPTTAPFSYAPTESEMFLFNWSDYFSPDNQKAFSEQFGITNFVYDTYPSNEDLLAKLQAGGKGGYDVAVPTSEFVSTLVAGGFLQKLDKARLPNLATINKQFKGLPSDPNDEYLIPKDWGTTGIIYRGKDVTEPVTSWKDFFDLATTKYSGKTFVVNSPGDVFVAPLAMHGFDVNTVDKDQLEIARTELLKLRPHLQSIDSDTYPQTLRDEAAVLGLAWNGTAYLLQQEDANKDTAYVVPSEGTIFWTDTWVLLAEAPHPNSAYAFLNWIQDANQQVIESLFSGYASCNDAAKPLLPPDFVNNPAVYVPESELSRLSVSTDQSGNQQRADIWAEFSQG